MNEQAPEIAAARIDRALARIDAASAAIVAGKTALSSRHAALRREIADAITALDSLIAEEVAD